jgi:ribosome-associated protein
MHVLLCAAWPVTTASGPGRIDLPLRVTDALTIGVDELEWRFSRSSGPGGQGVNTADSRVELIWRPAGSRAVARLPAHLRARLLNRLEPQLANGSIVVAVSAHRAQLRNREQARRRLAEILRAGMAPSPAARRPSRPTRGSIERRLAGKKARSALKASRSGRAGPDGD